MRISDWSSDVCSSDLELGSMRERYAQLMARPDRIEDILQAGTAKARRLSQPLMAALREAVGLRSPAVPAQASVPSAQKAAGQRDRKSDREGKGVVDRLDLRGSWIIYKKQHNTI